MFNLSNLKQTRFYQEVFAEGEAEGEAKERAEAKRREQAAILRMSNQGLSMEEIAIFLDLSLAEVEAIVQAAQSEQN